MPVADLKRDWKSDYVKVEWNHAKVDNAWQEFCDVRVDMVVKRYAHNVSRVKHQVHHSVVVNKFFGEEVGLEDVLGLLCWNCELVFERLLIAEPL